MSNSSRMDTSSPSPFRNRSKKNSAELSANGLPLDDMPADVIINSTPVKADGDGTDGVALSPTHPSFVPVNDLSSDEGEREVVVGGSEMNSTLLSRNLDVLPPASFSPNSNNEDFNNEQELSDYWDQVSDEGLEFYWASEECGGLKMR